MHKSVPVEHMGITDSNRYRYSKTGRADVTQETISLEILHDAAHQFQLHLSESIPSFSLKSMLKLYTRLCSCDITGLHDKS